MTVEEYIDTLVDQQDAKIEAVAREMEIKRQEYLRLSGILEDARKERERLQAHKSEIRFGQMPLSSPVAEEYSE